MAISSNFPTIRPSLNLDFANVKALDPRITFTRASTAAYYDGVTTAKAEENLFTYSQEFDNAAWTASDITKTANTEVAPDGTTTADTITENSSTAVHNIIQSITAVIGDSYTFSVFAKRNGRDIQLCFGSSDVSGNPYANFDLATGAVGTTGGTITASISSAGNSWYRCSVTVTSAVTTSFGCIVALIDSTAASRLPSYAGDNSSGAYLWGAQLEQRSAVSSYTATTTQPITNYIPVLQTAASDVARFDHNPTTGEGLGLLMEEQRTNIAPYSQQLDDAYWSKNRGSVISNTVVAPDGTLTGDKWYEDTQTGAHHIDDDFSTIPADNTVVTISIYAKAAERTRVFFRLFLKDNVTYRGADFNLIAGTFSDLSGGYTATMQEVGNGWFRLSITGSCGAGAVTPRLHVFLVNGAGVSSYTGDGYSGVYLWGAQAEAGAFPTSYIPTTSASVTRANDAWIMTGTNFSSWFNAGEFTIYSEFLRPTTANAASGGGPSVPRIYTIGTSSGGVVQLRLFSSTGLEATGPSMYMASTWTVSAWNKHALAVKVDDAAIVRDGGSAVTDSTVTAVTNVDTFAIGQNTSGTGNIGQGYIRKLAYYPQRLSNAQLQALTA